MAQMFAQSTDIASLGSLPMNLRVIAVAALLLPAVTFSAFAQTNLIGLDTINPSTVDLVSINPATGQATNLGNILSVLPNGALTAGASYDPASNTYSVLSDIVASGTPGTSSAQSHFSVATFNAATGALVSNVLTPISVGNFGFFNVIAANPGDFGNLNATGTATLNSAAITNGLTVGGGVQTTTLNTAGTATLNSAAITNGLTVGGGVQTTTLNATTSITTPVITATTANIQTLDVGTAVSVAPASTVDMGGNVVQNVGTPVNPTDAANKQYVDNSIAAVNIGLNQAFKKIDQNTQGIAIAMAMSGMALSSDKNVAFGGNVGFYGGRQAAAFQGMVRVAPNVTLNGGIGFGFQDSSQVGGRVGVQVEF